MATATPANMLVTSLLGLSLPIYTLYHAHKFDGCRCLIPSKKNKVRTGMLWMLMGSMVFFNIWTITWTRMKYDMGWIQLPEPYGFIPLPTPLGRISSNKLLFTDIMIIFAFSLYDGVNAEEFLWWTFLLRSTKKHSSGGSQRMARWVNSRVFWLWLGLTSITTFLHFFVPLWHNPSDDDRSIRIFVFEGASGIINVLLSVVLSISLPKFINQVADQGGSSDVISKLSFFQEMNKLRVMLRTCFAVCILMLGIDGKTKQQKLLLNRFSNDILFMVLALSFWLSIIISIMLYLPISYSQTDKEESQLTRRRATAMNFGRPEDSQYRTQRNRRSKLNKEERPVSALMSRHSVEHRNLLGLLRERGTVHENETVPEDALFDHGDDTDDEARSPKESTVGAYSGHGTDIDGDTRFASKDDILMTPHDHTRRTPYKRPPSERILAAMLPSAILAGPFGGIPVGPTVPHEVVVNITKQVEISRDDYSSSSHHSEGHQRSYPIDYKF